ncbi:hypothetical protein CL622_03325 [archaeon]|nr:hypothetical protein [archaeon]|tara:strand:- start:787 stop:1221 length:435 start_codon:yes stop_codon:yes gene_type:complete
MLHFDNKKTVFEYIKNKFSEKSKLILIRGSMATKPIKNYFDFDIEIYGDKLKKPYYEIAFVREKLVLISVYFYKYKEGEDAKSHPNIKILYGKYNDNIKPNFNKETYDNEEKIKRECQLVVDFFFKYLRTKEEKHLASIQKRIT